MTKATIKVKSIGFVDTFENGFFTGWTYNNNNVDLSINVKINGCMVKTIPSNENRPDVKAAGIAEANCGFSFSLRKEDLPKDGCSISLHEGVFDTVLANGSIRYSDGEFIADANQEAHLDKLAISTYLGVYDSVGANQNISGLVKLSMEMLANLPPNSLVAMAYLLILGRIPDPIGFQGSLQNKLNSEVEKRAFLTTMISSAEFAAKRSIAAATLDLKKSRFRA